MTPDSGEHEARMAALERSAELLADLLQDETIGDLKARLCVLVDVIPKWNPDRHAVICLMDELDGMLKDAAYQISKHGVTDEHF